MPDICDVILDEHDTFRRRFAELDEKHDSDQDTLHEVWQPLADLLDRHAAAEEVLLYPRLLRRGSEAEDETDDAVRDHNSIRDAVTDAARHAPGSHRWWAAVDDARRENSDHMAEEERDALADFRQHTTRVERDRLGTEFLAFGARHAGAAGLSGENVDPSRYIRDHEQPPVP